MKKKTNLSNAKRQENYRKRANKNNRCVLNTVISIEAFSALTRIAKRYAVTKREMIEKFIAKEDGKIVKRLEPGTRAWDEYFNI